jgi:DNA sulfur modification protein DndB
MKLIPAMRGKIGSIEYFVAMMKASEVVNSIRIPKEMPDWDHMSIEERYQREINYKRVKEQIAPYFANDPDRFFNALIVEAFGRFGKRQFLFLVVLFLGIIILFICSGPRRGSR